MFSIVGSAALVLAGVVAGIVGSAGGITSLVSYPALLVAGLSPFHASIANNVALAGCWPGSALASGPELQGRSRWVARFIPVAVVGAGAGAALLVLTPPHAFERIVPFLVLAGSLGLLFEPRLTAWRRRRRSGNRPLPFAAGLLALSIYNGYFGAGSGVMVLTLVLVLVDERLPVANALKNMLIGAGCLAAALLYAIVGPVAWAAVVPVGLGMVVGSNIGPRVARRIPTRVLRLLIVLLGFVLAAYLWIDPGA